VQSIIPKDVPVVRINCSKQVIWNINNYHSSIYFSIPRILGEVKGSFERLEGSLIAKEEMNFADADLGLSIFTKTITTGNKRRDKRLLGSRFLNASKHPEIKFKSICFERAGNNKYFPEGPLTVNGITKFVVFEAAFEGSKKNHLGNQLINFKITGKISPSGFGFRLNKLMNLLLGKDIQITITLECM
jgi:polyisoprenoid-binding protein YceI